MHGRSRGNLVAACALMALGCSASFAGEVTTLGDRHCTREDAQEAGPGDRVRSASLPAGDGSETSAIAAETARPLPRVDAGPTPLAAIAPAAHRGLWPAHFVDHFDFASRVQAIRRLKLFSVWDSARVTVFVGVNRAGIAGLHIQQQDPYDLAPLLHRPASSLAEAPPLRGVPLSAAP